MDIAAAFSQVKSLPDEALHKELAQPTGMIPGYMVLSEIQDRKTLRDTTPASATRPSMAEEISLKGYSAGGIVAGINPFNAYMDGLKSQTALAQNPSLENGPIPLGQPNVPIQAPNLWSLVPQQPGKLPGLEQPKHYANGGTVEEQRRHFVKASGLPPSINIEDARPGGEADDPVASFLAGLRQRDQYNLTDKAMQSQMLRQPMPLANVPPNMPDYVPVDATIRGYAQGGSVGLQPYQRKLLDAIAGRESAGKYNVMYGGKTFSDYSDHPHRAVPITSGPNAGQTSSAAGRYQFLGSTWDKYKNKLGLKDFSPANQDAAAYALASDTYGPGLDDALQSGDPARIAAVGQKLSGVWTSLPSGIEQGQGTNEFVNRFTGSDGAAYTGGGIASLPAAGGLTPDVSSAAMAAAPDPTGGLMSLFSMAQMMAPKAPAIPTHSDVTVPRPRSAPVDPQQLTEATSLTPDVYMRRRQYG